MKLHVVVGGMVMEVPVLALSNPMFVRRPWQTAMATTTVGLRLDPNRLPTPRSIGIPRQEASPKMEPACFLGYYAMSGGFWSRKIPCHPACVSGGQAGCRIDVAALAHTNKETPIR